MWLTTEPAAEKLGISVRTLRRRIAKGLYPTKYETVDTDKNITTKLYIWIDDAECQAECQTEKAECQAECQTEKAECQAECQTEKAECQAECQNNLEQSDKNKSPQIQPLTLPPILSDYGPDFFIKRTSGSMRDKLIETYLNLSRDEKSQVLGYVRQFMSERTWYSWVSRYRNRGHLKRKVRADRGKSRKELPTFMQELLQAILISHPQWNVQKAYEDMKLLAVNGDLVDYYTGEVYEDVSEYLVREWIKTSIVRDRWYFRWYPKSRRNLYTSMSHARGINPPNTVWMIDDHDQDVLVWSKDKDGNDRQIRPKVICVVP